LPVLLLLLDINFNKVKQNQKLDDASLTSEELDNYIKQIALEHSTFSMKKSFAN